MPCRQKLSPSNNTASTRRFQQKRCTSGGKNSSWGYVAYIVGGAVRDLLLGVSPKDFDIATDATPAQVRRLFRNSRIIGRRFRIVHLYFHHDNEAKIMEVSTFRAGDDSVCEESGRVLRDNYFGDCRQRRLAAGFLRQRFVLQPAHRRYIGLCRRLCRCQSQAVRVIGKPAVRFRQDPVRVLRALRISAKLNLSMAGVTQRALINTRRCWLTSRPPDCLMSLLRP